MTSSTRSIHFPPAENTPAPEKTNHIVGASKMVNVARPPNVMGAYRESLQAIETARELLRRLMLDDNRHGSLLAALSAARPPARRKPTGAHRCGGRVMMRAILSYTYQAAHPPRGSRYLLELECGHQMVRTHQLRSASGKPQQRAFCRACEREAVKAQRASA